jgi:hypothetical protein
MHDAEATKEFGAVMTSSQIEDAQGEHQRIHSGVDPHRIPNAAHLSELSLKYFDVRSEHEVTAIDDTRNRSQKLVFDGRVLPAQVDIRHPQ